MLSELLKNQLPVDRKKLRGKDFYRTITSAIEKSVRLIDSKHGWKNRESCIVCGSTDKRPEFNKLGVDIVECSNCSLRYITKIPVDPEDVYSDPSYLKKTDDSYIKFHEYRKERFGRERVALIEGLIGSLRSKRLVDIGSGSGYFLECAKEAGADCLGIELGDHVREWSIKATGIRIVKTALEKMDMSEKFDVITMFDLIEHVSDPVKLLKAANGHLRPDGIVVIFTPNFDSFGIKYMKERSNLVAPAEHHLYFTEKSISMAFDLAGLDIIYKQTYGMDIADILFYLEAQPEKKEGLIEFLSGWHSELQAMIDASGCANHIRIIGRKKKT